GNVLRKRHKKILKLAKSFKSARSRLFIVANQAVMKALKYQYRDRRNIKRFFRRLWISRINAAAREHGISYSCFMKGLKDSNIIINRKMLSDIAVKDPIAFKKIAELTKVKLSA
ncbi:MAG: 50S ribosomal protein L20, partial [Candidatus Melainabacteria bacterium GWF2_37_15]